MIRYIGTKMLDAEPMTRGEYNKFRGWKLPKDENGDDPGYRVVYPDDYVSWCPKKQFEDAYKPINKMNFGLAIEVAKQGRKIARKGWNGKNQYVEIASSLSYISASGEKVNAKHDAIGNKALAFCGTSGVQIGWLASQADMLAEDWCVVD